MDVDDLAAEDLGELHDLGAAVAVGGDLEQRQLARDRLVGLEVADLDHVDELVQLLGDLVDRVRRAVDGQRDPRDRLVVGRADGERVDVEAAPREQAGDPGEDARLVLDQQRQDVLAAGVAAARLAQVVEVEQLLGRRARPSLSPPCPARPGRRGSSGSSSPRASRGRRRRPVRRSRARSSCTSVSSPLSVTRMPVAP